MRVLVAGGAGYIGSVVTEELLAAGDEVVVYDDLSKGHRDAVPERAELVVGDILDTRSLTEALRSRGVEAVVHMAADSLVGESVSNPARYYRTNVVGGLSLLDAMKAASARLLVFSSTAAVYGEPERQPIDESAPNVPTNSYGQTKLAFEQALPWYERAHGLRFVSLRYFNAAGASDACGERHDPETHLIPVLLRAVAGDGPPATLFGTDYPTPDGTCIRDYVHVIDLARAHVLALRALASGHPSRVYNLGCGGDGYSVRQVVDAVAKATGQPVPTTIGPRRAGDPAVLVASSSRIRAELGWEPQLQSLDRIVASAWGWMQRRRRAT
jgi:UDP-glucose 4-epimerase